MIAFGGRRGPHRSGSMLLEPPACDNHFLTLVRRGMRRAQVEAGGTRDSRIPLPCEHLLTILRHGESAYSGLQHGVERLRAVRGTFGIALTSLFAGRQDSGVHLRTRDFGVDSRFIWLRLTEKLGQERPRGAPSTAP